MLGSNDYQVQAMEKEEAKLRFKREQNEIRRQRFQNARVRTIGVDVDALNAQVEEKRQGRNNLEESNRQERLRAMELERVLEEAALEDKRNRQQQNDTLKSSWSAAMVAKKAIPRESDTDYSRCGIAAAQIFDGEDNGRSDRVRSQRELMRKWINDQLNEREETKQSEAEDERRWVEYVAMTTELRDEAERREVELMKAHKAAVLATNKELAQQHYDKYKAKDRSAAPEPTSIAAFNSEDVTQAIDEYGRITRRDMFKGFTAAQRRRILQDNEVIMAMRREALYSEQRENEYWVLQQLAQSRAMEQVLYEERRMRDEAMEDQLKTLSEQIDQSNERKREYARGRFGGIGEEFFDKFGKDCR